MIDINKRKVLKVIGGTAVAASIPSLAGAAENFFSVQPKELDSANGLVLPVSAGTELSITLSVDPVPTVRMVNLSNQAIVVRHVYPGIVHAGHKTFDINSIFSEGGYEINVGASRDFEIKPTYGTQAEVVFPRQKYRNKPQRVVAVRGADRNGAIINSSRSFYS